MPARRLDPIRVAAAVGEQAGAIADWLGILDAADWERPTPLPEWTVTHLVLHLAHTLRTIAEMRPTTAAPITAEAYLAALPSAADLTAVRVGGTAWITVPGELQTRLGLDIKTAGRRGFDETFVAGYSNDYLGYFLTRQDYGRPSYVACGSLYGETGGEIVRDAAVDLLDRLAAQRSGR